MNKKLLVLLISILLVIDIPFLLYSFSFFNTAFDEDFHKKEFQKLDVYNKLSDYNIEEINSEVLTYLKNDKTQNLIKNDFFNEREKQHLLDVKNLIQTIKKIYYFSVILFFILFFSLIFLLNKAKIMKQSGRILLIGGLLTFVDAFMFYIMINMNFVFSFDSFHKLFFKEGSFLFDPLTENIVNLYPQALFFDFTYKIAISTLVFSFVMFLIGLLILLNKKIFKPTRKFEKS